MAAQCSPPAAAQGGAVDAAGGCAVGVRPGQWPLRRALLDHEAFDADARVLEPLAAAGKTAVIPPRTNRSSPRDYHRGLYAARHLIENFFARIKQFRAIATHYDKTARNILSAVQLVASVVWLN